MNQGSKAEKIILFVTRKHAPYVLTKPFHPTQKLIEENEYGITIFLEIQHNLPDNSPGKPKIIDLEMDKNVQSILN